MDTAGPPRGRRAPPPHPPGPAPAHPSLIDVGHLMSERFGVVNIPNGLWIDEDGMIVRPAEPAFPGPRTMPGGADPSALPARMRETIAVAAAGATGGAGDVAALPGWARPRAARAGAPAPPPPPPQPVRADARRGGGPLRPPRP